MYTFLNDLGLNVGRGAGVVGSFCIKKSMLDGCGYWERCGEILFICFPQQCCPIYSTWELISETWLMGISCVHTHTHTHTHIYIYIYIYIYFLFGIVGAIYCLTHTSIDTVQN
jgi:hypothetical protein